MAPNSSSRSRVDHQLRANMLMRCRLERTPVTAAEAAAEEAALELPPPAFAAAALACLNAVRAPSLPSILPLSLCGFVWVEQEASECSQVQAGEAAKSLEWQLDRVLIGGDAARVKMGWRASRQEAS